MPATRLRMRVGMRFILKKLKALRLSHYSKKLGVISFEISENLNDSNKSICILM